MRGDYGLHCHVRLEADGGVWPNGVLTEYFDFNLPRDVLPYTSTSNGGGAFDRNRDLTVGLPLGAKLGLDGADDERSDSRPGIFPLEDSPSPSPRGVVSCFDRDTAGDRG